MRTKSAGCIPIAGGDRENRVPTHECSDDMNILEVSLQLVTELQLQRAILDGRHV